MFIEAGGQYTALTLSYKVEVKDGKLSIGFVPEEGTTPHIMGIYARRVQSEHDNANGALYIMSNAARESEVGRNEILVFRRNSSDGKLQFADTVITGGFGGLAGAVRSLQATVPQGSNDQLLCLCVKGGSG